jgi:DNA-binding NtrC family response regulator
VQVRIIAATNVPLEERVAHGRFRLDLYFRLAGGCVVLPPLRQRAGDVLLLARHFERVARSTLSPRFGGLSDRVLREMERYRWPGNVRQLRSEIFRLAALTPEGSPVEQWSPPLAPSAETPDSAPSPPASGSSLDRGERGRILRSPERLRQILRESEGRVSLIVRRLGVSRSHLYRVLRRHHLDPSSFRLR